jgi:hypothetical protein
MYTRRARIMRVAFLTFIAFCTYAASGYTDSAFARAVSAKRDNPACNYMCILTYSRAFYDGYGPKRKRCTYKTCYFTPIGFFEDKIICVYDCQPLKKSPP